MTGVALLLVLIAAFCHAGWNLLAKRACGGTAFTWLFSSLSALLYFPLMLWVLTQNVPDFGLRQVLWILGSAALHSLYILLLDRGYRYGDLSVIYPLARGTGPMLSVLTAIVLLGERPGPLALAGTLGIGLGIVIITGNPFRRHDHATRKSIVFAMSCGAAIAAYTVVDKVAVSVFLLPPLLMDWCTNFGRVLLLSPYALKHWPKIKEQWSLHKREAIGVSILSPLAYILVLTAMVHSPVSYIAPAREISILIGSVLGARLLAEGNLRPRLIGACTMFLGLVALSLG